MSRGTKPAPHAIKVRKVSGERLAESVAGIEYYCPCGAGPWFKRDPAARHLRSTLQRAAQKKERDRVARRVRRVETPARESVSRNEPQLAPVVGDRYRMKHSTPEQWSAEVLAYDPRSSRTHLRVSYGMRSGGEVIRERWVSRQFMENCLRVNTPSEQG